jgi:hypothetical protein
MAIDTRDKRSSAIDVSLPWRNKLPLPDSTVDQSDRQHAMFYYSGILAAAPTGGDTGGPLVGGFLVNRSKIIWGRAVR